MILKIRLGRFRVTFTFSPVIDVIGVNSLLPDGNHILMWDFDNTPIWKVRLSLTYMQLRYGLPDIYILQTNTNNYIAYCFSRQKWRKAVEIIAATPDICENFFKWGVFRKRFTLRVSRKSGRKPKLIRTLYSSVPESASITELRSWVQYETIPDCAKKQLRLISLGSPGVVKLK